MTEAEAEREILSRRTNDVGFFRLGRIWYALRHDPTAVLEIAVALLGLLLNGGLIAFAVTSFPPSDVQFLLRSWPLMGERSLGLVLLALGVSQVLGTATRWHHGRALVAGLAFVIVTLVAMAYLFADLPSYFQAWVMYSAIAACEFYLVVRNLRDHGRVKDAGRLMTVALKARGYL